MRIQMVAWKMTPVKVRTKLQTQEIIVDTHCTPVGIRNDTIYRTYFQNSLKLQSIQVFSWHMV